MINKRWVDTRCPALAKNLSTVVPLSLALKLEIIWRCFFRFLFSLTQLSAYGARLDQNWSIGLHWSFAAKTVRLFRGCLPNALHSSKVAKYPQTWCITQRGGKRGRVDLTSPFQTPFLTEKVSAKLSSMMIHVKYPGFSPTKKQCVTEIGCLCI